MEKNILIQKINNAVDCIIQQRTIVFGCLVAVIVGITGLWGYKNYQNRVQIAAHKTFMEALKQLETPVQEKGKAGFASTEQKWNTVQETFKSGYEKHKSSTLAPMFLAFQANALTNLGKQDEALASMKQAVNLMAASPLKSYYEVTLSVMQLDNKNKQEQEAGIKHLQSIANDPKQIAQSQALFNLGQYEWSQKKFTEAKNYWQQFLIKFGDTPGFEAQTAAVKEKFDLLS